MNFREALRELDSRQPENMPEPSLDRISKVAELLDHPQLAYPSIHVTGTNGKTTTARMVASLACGHGISTGTFISPHLESVTERLSLCGQEISEDEFAEEYERLLPYLEQGDGVDRRVTYFEALTALAYIWFADKPVGLGVFEVGMGGAWDATNLVRGEVSVLCPIGLDHRELGATVAEVATEKAGIVKPGMICVLREQRPEALEVIERRGAEMGATILREDEAFAVRRRSQAVAGQLLEIQGVHAAYSEIFVPLFGEATARNAAASIAACEAFLDRALDEGTVRASLRDVTSPGRLEVAARRPLVVLDGAHNPDAMAELAVTLSEAFRWERLHLVLAMFGDKDVEGALRFLGPLVDRAYLAPNTSPRSAAPERLARALADAGVANARMHGTVADAVADARASAGERDLILVTGSFYTVGDARPLFSGGPDSRGGRT